MLELIPREHEHERKVYVPVWAYYTTDGQIKPLAIRMGSETIKIDRVLDIRPGASRKLGGAGIRYVCRVEGKELVIFLEDNRWFMEA